MREKIRTRLYVMTLHAEEEMNNDSLSIFDVERAILTGAVVERQEDHATGEWKYLIAGQSIHGEDVEDVAKISVTEKLVIITVFKG
jgi:Domain of unknown function (DUF4258)